MSFELKKKAISASWKSLNKIDLEMEFDKSLDKKTDFKTNVRMEEIRDRIIKDGKVRKVCIK